MPPLPPSVAAPRGGSAGSDRGGTLDANILGLLRNMERDDLQNLNDRTIESLLSDDGDLNKLRELKLTESTSNRSLAEHSLSQEGRLEQGRRALISAHREAADLARQHRQLLDQLNANQRGGSMDSLHTLLQSACLEAEESGEAILDKFLSNQMSLPEFVSRYTEARSLYHTRRAKADKVTEISNQRIVQASAGYRTASMPGGAGPTGGPMGPPTMPPPMPPPTAAGYGGLPPYYYPAPAPAYQPFGSGRP